VKVAIVGAEFADSFAENAAVSLRAGSHEVENVPPFRRLPKRRSPLATRLRDEMHLSRALTNWSQGHLADEIAGANPDLVLVLDYRIAPSSIDRIREASKAPVVFWFPDPAGNLRRETHVLSKYDALFFKDSALVRHYRSVLGLNAYFLPEACNPVWHRPMGDVCGPTAPAVLVAGNVYPTRFLLLRRLVGAGVGVQVYGAPWARWLPSDPTLDRSYTGRFLAREKKAQTFRSAPVVLNSLVSTEGDGLNCRLFEAAGCGAVVLTEWRPRLPELFRDNEVRSYTDFEGLVDQLKELVSLPVEQRRSMGDAAAARAHGEHTYLHRFESIVDVIGKG
jgi:spore maturation protein CgeB